MKLSTLPRICVTLIFCLFSFAALSQIDNFQKEFTRLTNELSKANKQQAEILIPKIRALYLSISKKRSGTQAELDQNLKLYKETFSLLERMNPFDAKSSDCLDKKITPREKEIRKLDTLSKNVGGLLDQSKIKAGQIGDFDKCGSSDCKAYVTGVADKCSSSDCKAYITGDINKCSSSDCKAYISGDAKKCSSRDCKAYISGDFKHASYDCQAFLTGDVDKCASYDCKAYLTGDAKKCASSDCKTYVPFDGIGRLLKVKTHKIGYQKGSIPIQVILRRQQKADDDQATQDATNAMLMNAATTSTNQ